MVPERRRSDGPDGRDVRRHPGGPRRPARRGDVPPGRPGRARTGWPCCTRTTWATCTPRSAPRRSSPRLRLVVRMFNTSLANGVRQLFPDSAVLSDASMAAPGLRGRRARRGRPDPLPARRAHALRGPPRRRTPAERGLRAGRHHATRTAPGAARRRGDRRRGARRGDRAAARHRGGRPSAGPRPSAPPAAGGAAAGGAQLRHPQDRHRGAGAARGHRGARLAQRPRGRRQLGRGALPDPGHHAHRRRTRTSTSRSPRRSCRWCSTWPGWR